METKNKIMRSTLGIYLMLTFVVWMSFQKAVAQDGYKPIIPDKQYLKSYWTDTKDIVLSPTKWKTKDWITAGVVAGGTVFLYHYDLEIEQFFQNRQSRWATFVSKHSLERWGGVYALSTIALFYGHGMAFKNNRSQKVALMSLKAYILSGLMVQIPKVLINRHRPYHDNPPRHDIFEGPSLKLYKSFPSGHTISAFSLATVIASEYWSTGWIPALSYSMATLVGISRMYDKKHWSSDVLVGAALGYAIGRLVHRSENWKWNAYPSVSHNTAGLSINYTF